MPSKIQRIEVDYRVKPFDVSFFFTDKPEVPYGACEFKNGSATRKLLNSIENLIRSRKSSKNQKRGRLLTGSELRIAIANKLPVYYVETYDNPQDSHMNYSGVCKITPATVGYYIGNSDIQPEDYRDEDSVESVFPEGSMSVHRVIGISYR